ncbi:hypothetical protein [Methanobacterium sp. ACI-7]|uniref:hypothetical protein n=1 Tax=unclassified Methanobacterium TaxID=2627676 RepID=UPI0039C4DDC0
MDILKKPGGDIIKRNTYFMSIVALCLVLGGLFYSTPLNSQIQQNEQIRPLSAQMTGDLVQVEAKSVTKKGGAVSTRAKCSCSMLTDYAVHTQSWSNYCPQCNSRGTLIFEKTGDCPEGMVRCTSCDADFCAVHGKEHVYKGATRLRSA